MAEYTLVLLGGGQGEKRIYPKNFQMGIRKYYVQQRNQTLKYFIK